MIKHENRRYIPLLSLMLSFLLCLHAASFAEEGERPAVSGLSPTTGLPTDRPYRPFLVTVSNAPEARPAWNLSEADIVYEMIIWGPGHTRYAALYNDNHPKRVGPVRSARTYHAYLRQEWDCPLVHSGGMGHDMEAIEIFMAHGVLKRFQFDTKRTGPYSEGVGRDRSRRSPHNLVVNLSLMFRSAWPMDLGNQTDPYEPSPPLFQFSETPTKGKQDSMEIEIHFEGISQKKPNYFPRYVYNPTINAYERWYCGFKQYDAGTRRIIAHNVIVQRCHTSYINNQASQPVIDLTGAGHIDAFIDGKHIEGTWRRETMNSKTQFFDADGNVLTLRPGKTFIQIVPTDYGFDYDEETGLFRYAPDL